MPGPRQGAAPVPSSPPRPGPRPGGPGPAARLSLQGIPDSIYGALLEPLRTLGVLSAHGLGLTGSGVRVGILAPAFRTDHDAFRSARVVAARDFVDGDTDVGPGPTDPPDAAELGTAVWSLVGGRIDGTLLAPAFEADVLLARVGGAGVPLLADEARWVEGMEWLVAQGAQVIVSALGFRNFADFSYDFQSLDGDGTAASGAADAAASAGVLVVVPMGNGGPGPGTLLAPADGDSVLAVGAGAPDLATLDFSSRGPTADGRSRPQLLAPGEGLTAASATAPDAVGAVAGTEFAAALVGGAAALFLQAHGTRGPTAVAGALTSAGAGRVEPPAVENEPPTPHAGSAVLLPEGFRSLPLAEVAGGRATTLVPVFRWEIPSVLPEALPIRHRLTVAVDEEMSDVRLEGEVTGSLSLSLAEPLPPRVDVFWRVEAETGAGVRRRTAVRGPIMVPPWVTLRTLNQPGGSNTVESRPTFSWDAFTVPQPAGPLTFDLEVLSDRDGSLVVRAAGLTEQMFRPSRDLPFNRPLSWRVVARATAGAADTATSAGPFVVTSRSRPPVTILFQNFPNPFPAPGDPAPETRIWFDLAEPSPVSLTVHDLRGRLVRRLIPRRGCGRAQYRLEPGEYGRSGAQEEGPCVLLHWDGRSEGGDEVAPGVYLLRLRAGGREEVRRMVFWP